MHQSQQPVSITTFRIGSEFFYQSNRYHSVEIVQCLAILLAFFLRKLLMRSIENILRLAFTFEIVHARHTSIYVIK